MIFVFAVVKIKRVCECKRFFISLIHNSLVYFLEQLGKLYQKSASFFIKKKYNDLRPHAFISFSVFGQSVEKLAIVSSYIP